MYAATNTSSPVAGSNIFDPIIIMSIRGYVI